ncbi:MAG TPA: 4-hydroxyphenylacetate 3-hydroxylase N-terminal domain-containing protein [bacterium]|nr:4-hydroxyphenylacetate 3-hydroxylase N-terminal domain-containing protein [bacterium]
MSPVTARPSDSGAKQAAGTIWVLASHHDGRVDTVALELLGKGAELAARGNLTLEAVIFGSLAGGLAEELLDWGPAVVHWVGDPRLDVFSSVTYAWALAELARRHRPEIILLGSDSRNASLAARVAARLGTGLSAHCIDIKLERGLLVQTVPGFGGNILANIVCPEARPQMATVTPGVFRAVRTRRHGARVVKTEVPIPDGLRNASLRETRRRESRASRAVEKAEIVVAGGFGVGSRENWTLLEELASVLKAAVGATRPPVDEGWAAAEQMIGASGKVIAPKLYICAGVSGMMHHTVGIQRAKTIVAINSDPRAPIFAAADYGLVGDLREVLPALTHRLRTGQALAREIQPPENTRTAGEFRESLRRMTPNIYKFGTLIEDPVSDPRTRRTVEGHAQIYEAARDPRYQDLLTTVSHLTGKRVSRYLSIIRSPEDMFANSRLKRLMFQLTGTCTGGRCAGWAALNAMWSTTWDIDKQHGTNYHQRLQNWLADAQARDIAVAGALTDAKGQRRLAPSKQPDPDMYLHVIERRPDGIVVRGAKVMICGTAAANEIFVMPTTRLRRDDADYAVSFVIPKDTPGLTIVEARHASDIRDLDEGFDNPVAHGGITQAYLFFDKVFVPTERVFMNGEYDFAGEAVFRFTLPYRSAIGGCVAGQGDVMIGASILIARANGLDEKVFRDKLTQMIINNETTFGMGIAAAVMGSAHPSGAWLPDPVLAHATKVHVATLPYETKRLTQEIAGGIAETGCMPSYEDFMSGSYGHLIQKYLKANSPAETRMRVARLIEWLTLGAGVPGCMHGGGSPDGARMTVWSEARLDEMIEMAKRIGGISDISLAKPPGK